MAQELLKKGHSQFQMTKVFHVAFLLPKQTRNCALRVEDQTRQSKPDTFSLGKSVLGIPYSKSQSLTYPKSPDLPTKSRPVNIPPNPRMCLQKAGCEDPPLPL